MLQLREIRAAGAGGAVVLLYLALVLGSGRVPIGGFARLFSFYLSASFMLWALVGGTLFFARLLLKARRSGQEAFLADHVQGCIRERWERDRFVSLFWPPLLFALLMSSFNAFKQMILPLAGFRLDPMLAGMDRALFLGNDPWRVTHALFGEGAATLLIDRAYHGWFVPMSVGLAVCAFLPASSYRLRTQYLLTYIGVWIGLGSILAFLMPSAGPCYYAQFVGPSPTYDALLESLRNSELLTGSPLKALRNQAMLLQAFGSDQLRVGVGISAMPSVHNALAALFAMAAFRLNRTAGLLLTIYAIVIWIGSIHLGWHYAVDGPVAVALTFGMWRISGRIADAFDRSERAITPSAAIA